MTLVLSNIYGVDITSWSASNPGVVIQETGVFDNGNFHLQSEQGVPLQIDGSHASNLKLQLAGKQQATKAIHMGYQNGRDFISRSSISSRPDGDMEIKTDGLIHIKPFESHNNS